MAILSCQFDADGDLWPHTASFPLFSPRTPDRPQPRPPALRWLDTNGWSSRLSHLWLLPRRLRPKPRLGEPQPPLLLLPAQWLSPKALRLLNRSRPPMLLPQLRASPPSMFKWGRPSLAPSIKPQVGPLMASSPSAPLPRCSTCPPSREVLTSLMDPHSPAFLRCLTGDIKNIISQVLSKGEAWAPGDPNHSQPNNTNLQDPRRPTSLMCHRAWPPTTLDPPFHQR